MAAESKASQQEEQIRMLEDRVHVMQAIMGPDFVCQLVPYVCGRRWYLPRCSAHAHSLGT